MSQNNNNELLDIDNILYLDESVIVKNMMDYLLPEYLKKVDQINSRALEIVNESRKSISLIKVLLKIFYKNTNLILKRVLFSYV